MIYAALLVLLFLALYCYHKKSLECTSLDEKLKTAEQFKETFHSLSAEVLEKNNRSFLELAKNDLGQKQSAIGEMVQKLESNIRQLENERKIDHGAIRQQLKSLMESEQQLKLETSNLVKALRSPITRGRWGEIQLRRVVELAGMISHCDFFEQMQEDGFRPDLVVWLPGGRQVVVDSKVPLEAYLDAIQAPDDAIRLAKLKDHARQVRAHVQNLSKKSYWEHFQPTPEFVVLFLPSETVFSAALEQDPGLIEIGADQNVILATPTTLIALLRAVAYGWKNENLSRHAELVSELGHELYKRVVDMADHWSRTGRALGSAVDAYNKATGSLETRLLVTARKFKDLGAASTTLEIEESEIVDRVPRELQAPDFKD